MLFEEMPGEALSGRRSAPTSPVYVLCPAGLVTGGPEALHQLAHKINVVGGQSRVVYVPFYKPAVTPEVYERYQVTLASNAPDEPGVTVVIPETLSHRASWFRKAQVVIWWLSVDNYLNDAGLAPTKRLAKQVIRKLPYFQPYMFEDRPRLRHAAQSHYAKLFLEAKGLRAEMLSDYLRTDFVQSSDGVDHPPKENIIAFNPAKGIVHTRRIQEAAKGAFEWLPLQGMTPEGVRGALRRAKVYIDFGPHPGRDRLPREAALSGCCVVTGRDGAAANSVDVPIPEEFKVGVDAPDFASKVCTLLDELTANFDRRSPEFNPYRRWVRDGEARFEQEVSALLGLNSEARADADKPRLQIV